MEQGGNFVSPFAQISRSEIMGEPIYFTISNPSDVIQSAHFQGKFYEEEELDIIRRFFPLGGRFCDIGANVGNHTIFLSKFLRAREVMVFEPNPATIPLLESNIMLNGLGDVVDTSYLGYGLSDRQVNDASIDTPYKDNLGLSVVSETGGSIPLVSGDNALAGKVFDLIKIDVEGMEMKVLNGLKGYLKNNPVPIFIEVDNDNIDSFLLWVDEFGYKIKDSFRRYEANINYLVVPNCEE